MNKLLGFLLVAGLLGFVPAGSAWADEAAVAVEEEVVADDMAAEEAIMDEELNHEGEAAVMEEGSADPDLEPAADAAGMDEEGDDGMADETAAEDHHEAGTE